jgi:hypothetical protein
MSRFFGFYLLSVAVVIVATAEALVRLLGG